MEALDEGQPYYCSPHRTSMKPGGPQTITRELSSGAGMCSSTRAWLIRPRHRYAFTTGGGVSEGGQDSAHAQPHLQP